MEKGLYLAGITKTKIMRLLELFAGSRSIGQEAERQGAEVYSVDWKQFENIDMIIDIGKLSIKNIPFVPDMIWASPDCTTYSIAACSTHRTNTKEPKTAYAKQCDETNKHWLGLINEWLEINPDMVYFIENPRGMLRHMDFMQGMKRHTIWFCQYSDIRAKPTDIWTNSKAWTPRAMCKNFKYDKEGNIINRHCHHESARRGARTGTQGLRGSFERSKIPKELCKEIIESLTQTQTS